MANALSRGQMKATVMRLCALCGARYATIRVHVIMDYNFNKSESELFIAWRKLRE